MSRENIMKPTVSYVSFHFDVPKVSALKASFSPEFIVRGKPWKISFYKSHNNSEQYLAMSLICANKNDTSDWSRIAHASVELPVGVKQSARKMYTTPCVFNRNETEWDRWLLKWNELFDPAKKFVKNDTLSAKIEIFVADPNDDKKSELIFENIGLSSVGFHSVKYRLTIKNADRLLVVRSPEIIFQNAPWYLVVFKDHKKQYGVRLECRNFEHPEFSANVKMTVKLVDAKTGGKSIEQTKTKVVKYNNHLYIKSLASHAEVFNPLNGFVKRKSIVIEVGLEPNEPVAAAASPTPTAAPAAAATAVDTNANNVPTQRRFELECAICLERLEGQPVSSTPCGHLFCSECIENSIRIYKACPVCRIRVITRQVKRAHLPL